MKSFHHSTIIGFALVLALWCESYGQDADDKEGEVVIVATTPDATPTTAGEVVIVATTDSLSFAASLCWPILLRLRHLRFVA